MTSIGKLRKTHRNHFAFPSIYNEIQLPDINHFRMNWIVILCLGSFDDLDIIAVVEAKNFVHVK